MRVSEVLLSFQKMEKQPPPRRETTSIIDVNLALTRIESDFGIAHSGANRNMVLNGQYDRSIQYDLLIPTCRRFKNRMRFLNCQDLSPISSKIL
jgi:hypothetical protein